ncbi:MAG TPA: hypothetical protein VL463_29085 [Kofleriaceae bacterium]|nr:hypothetical protein [Kofleriaceae bacterium]
MRASLAVVLALALGASRARAETVANESADLSATPSLGRGYTPAINGFHSVCFDEMPTTKPSFDFDYTFEDLELDDVHAVKRREALRTVEVGDFLARNTRERAVTSGKTTLYVHYMLASLIVDSYYASIDEAHATISKDALELLRKGDIVSFFTSCGTHYVRSLSRRSYFLSLFSYTTSDQRRDQTFELKVEEEVRKIAAKSQGDTTFTDQAKAHDLKIVTRSIGLTGEKSTAALLPFDLASYQDSVKEAFKASQDEHVGRVTSMEIQPWMSNTQILVLFGGIKYPNDEVDWNERKRILSDNAEFYIELSRHLLDMTTEVHRAEACRQAVEDQAFKDHALLPEYKDATIINQRTGERAPLSLLLAAVSDANIDKMRAIGLAIRGGADGKSGAAACMAELERTNLGGKFHNDIPSCNWSREPLPGARVIHEYCPPHLERPAAP